MLTLRVDAKNPKLSHWDLVSDVPLEMVMEANMGRCIFSAVQCYEYIAKKNHKKWF
jgi:hypothetical protein